MIRRKTVLYWTLIVTFVLACVSFLLQTRSSIYSSSTAITPENVAIDKQLLNFEASHQDWRRLESFHGTEITFQLPELQIDDENSSGATMEANKKLPKALLLMLHGCGRTAVDWFDLPLSSFIPKIALEHNIAVLSISSIDAMLKRSGMCWNTDSFAYVNADKGGLKAGSNSQEDAIEGMEKVTDIVLVNRVTRRFIVALLDYYGYNSDKIQLIYDGKAQIPLPLMLTGASSGGSFVSILPDEMRKFAIKDKVEGVEEEKEKEKEKNTKSHVSIDSLQLTPCSSYIIISPGMETAYIQEANRIPTVFLSMNKDDMWASPRSALKQKEILGRYGVASDVILVDDHPITADAMSNSVHSGLLTPGDALKFKAKLNAMGYIDENGYLTKSPSDATNKAIREILHTHTPTHTHTENVSENGNNPVEVDEEDRIVERVGEVLATAYGVHSNTYEGFKERALPFMVKHCTKRHGHMSE